MNENGEIEAPYSKIASWWRFRFYDDCFRVPFFTQLLLNNTLHHLLKNELGREFRIQKSSVQSFGPDSAAVWWIEFDGILDVNQLSPEVLGLAYDSDAKYYRREFERRFDLPPGYTDSYVLLRGGKPLGNFTICDATHCNFELLLDRNGKTAFASISKT